MCAFDRVAYTKAYYQEHKEQMKAQSAQWYLDNQDRVKQYQVDNKERLAERWVLYRAGNVDKVNDIHARYRAANPEKVAARVTRRRTGQIQSTPDWADEFLISEMYSLAQLRTKVMGYDWQVDHIVPLNSKLVCGLHVECNLRVIPGRENLSKSNRHWPNMP